MANDNVTDNSSGFTTIAVPTVTFEPVLLDQKMPDCVTIMRFGQIIFQTPTPASVNDFAGWQRVFDGMRTRLAMDEFANVNSGTAAEDPAAGPAA